MTHYANRFWVERKDIGMRIEFQEIVHDHAGVADANTIESRGAYVMTLDDAKALHRVLGQLLYPDTVKQ